MAQASYATAGTGPLAGAIGWINFQDLTSALTIGAPTIVNNTLRDGSTISFTVTNTGSAWFSRSLVPTWTDSPFGNAGYLGLTGYPALYGGGNVNNIIKFTNIVVKDPYGITIPDYTIVALDAEATKNNESMTFQTDGSPWDQLGYIGTGNSAQYSGLGTTLVNAPGISTSYHSLVLTSVGAKNVSITLFTPGAAEGLALGVILTKFQIQKVLNARLYSNDQFNLSITGTTLSATTITNGASTGLQSQNPYLYILLDSVSNSTFIMNETMAPGSTGVLGTDYITTVKNTNVTPGGTTVPANGFLGESITAYLGDWMLTTITNTVLTSTLTATKTVDKIKASPGDTLTYTINLNNSGPRDIANTVFSDTIPSGSSFVANSLTVNGVSIPGTVAPPSGINIGTIPSGQSSTLTFQVLLQSTLPLNSAVKNTSTAVGVNVLIPNVTITANSNIVTTTIIGYANLSSSKIAKTYANIGDTLTYTIPITNTGNTTAINIRFSDTIPNGTTLVASSIKQDGLVISGSPNPPGVTLPNPLGAGKTSTITFQVTVITLPTPNPIPNYASMVFQYTIDNSTVPNVMGSGSSNTNLANTFINRADLSGITKITDKSLATLNDVITYTITIPNTGTTSANSVIFKDTIPTGTTFVTNSFTLNGVVKTGVTPAPPGINIGTIPAGSIFTVSFKVNVNTIPSPNKVTNSATTTFTYQVDPSVVTTTNASVNSNIVSTTIIKAAIINPTKSVDLLGAFIGDTLNYTIVFKNTGTTTANNIIFTDTTPNGTTFVPDSVSINGTTQTGITLNPPNVVTLPNLGINQSATLTFQVTVTTTPSPNPTTNIGTTSYNYTDTTSGTSGTSINNTNIVSTQIYPDSNPFKTVDKQYATVGDTLTYQLGWINVLGVQETNVTFVDTIPSGTTFVANSVTVGGLTIPGVTVTAPNGINTGTLSAGQLVTVSFKVIVNTIPSPNPVQNETTIIYQNTLVAGLQSDVSNITNTQINLANLSVPNKTVDKNFVAVGDTLTYTVTLANTGNTTAENVLLFDTIPTGTSFIDGSFLVNGVVEPGENPDPPLGGGFIGTIPASSVTTIVFKVLVNTIPSPNSIPNTASLTGDFIFDPVLGTTMPISGNTNTVISKVYFADLINPTKGVDKVFADVPTTLTYTITITNSGNRNADNVVFVDTVPDGTNLVLNSVTVNGLPISGASPNPPGVTIGTIPIGATSTVTFKVTVNTIPTINPIPNTGTVGYNFIVDPTLLTTATGVHNTNTVYTTINHASLGNIIKFTDKQYAQCGDIITYTISIPNTGNVDALNVVLSDTVPNGTIYVSNSLQVDGNPIGGTPDSINVGTVPAGGTSIVTFKVQINC